MIQQLPLYFDFLYLCGYLSQMIILYTPQITIKKRIKRFEKKENRNTMTSIPKKTKIAVLFILLFLSIGARAQSNMPYSDDKTVHFGFSLGLNFMDFAVIPTDKTNDVNVTTLMPGFSVGAISDLRLSRYFNLRFTPTLHLGQRTLKYTDDTNIDVLSIPLYLPLYFKYSSERNGNFRPYVIGGGGIWWDWGRNKEKAVLLKQFDEMLEVGVGCDIYFSFFKLSPELKFAIGLDNMLVPLSQRDGGLISEENKKYTNSINKLTTKMITLSFNFE
ncbi:MAG: outer membrane beta-barrel protein [Paludibacteraceae bacterium]